MSKVKDIIPWLREYELGYPLEQSKDKFNWYNLDHEPFVGSNFFYRKRKPKEEKVISEATHQSDDDYLP